MNAQPATIAATHDPSNHRAFAGADPQPVDRVLAALVQDNYDRVDQRRGDPPIDRPLPAGWARMDDDALRAAGIDPSLQHDAKSGFDASFYRNDQGSVALVYAGSDEGKDWKHNFGQGLGFKDAQYDQAIALAKEAKLAFGDSLVLSGQSLGGGLAASAAMVNEVPAVTFNAAGVHDKTIERYGLDADVVKQQADEGLVRHYVVENEILTHLQEKSFPLHLAMPDAPGARINLPDPDPLTTFERLLPWKTWPHRVQNHFIEAVIESMDKAGYTLEDANPARNAGSTRNASLEGANRLLDDSVRGLAPQRESLGLQEDGRFFNTAAGVAASAGRDGLRRIDHVVPSADGQSAFAVEGALHDAGHRRSRVDLDVAGAMPMSESVAALRSNELAPVEQQAQRERQLAIA